MKKSTVVFILFFAPILLGMEHRENPLTVYAVPGQNVKGGESWYIKDIFGGKTNVIFVPTPSLYDGSSLETAKIPDLSSTSYFGQIPDFGQHNCLEHLQKTMAHTHKDDEKFIFHGTSQGTATILNYLAQPNAKKPAAVILESVLGSGNSAIHHTVNSALYFVRYGFSWTNFKINFKAKENAAFKTIAKYTLAYYWMPYFATMFFPPYRPSSGLQAIKSVSAIPNDIPIIIIHAIDDPQLSHDDACALYYGLVQNGNQNVYFIPKDGCEHIRLLAYSDPGKNIVRQILRDHTVLKRRQAVIIDSAIYKPDPELYKEQYENLLNKELNHEKFFKMLFYGVPTTALFMMCYFTSSQIGRLISYLSLYRA